MEKIIHQIWIGPYEMPEIEQEYSLSIKNNNSECEYMFWTDNNIPQLPYNLQEIYDILGKAEDYAFQADLMRLFLVYTYGGLYLDVDYKYINTFEKSNFFDYDGIFFYHPSYNTDWGGDFTIPNGIFGSKKKSKILEYIISTLTKENYWMGPSFLGSEVRRFLQLNQNESHDIVKSKLSDINFLYYSYDDLQNNYVVHNALASWIPEHKKEFQNGNVNFQKGKK